VHPGVVWDEKVTWLDLLAEKGKPQLIFCNEMKHENTFKLNEVTL
jgi:hypothetical protein